MIVAVDFDGTLTTGEGEPYWVDPLDKSPNGDVIETINELYERGHKIIVYTARRENVRTETEMWLDRFDVKYHSLRMEKLGFDVLIDDRAMKPMGASDPDLVENFVEEEKR